MNISIRQLKAFVTAAEQGSFTRAAAQLHITQSALSGLIRELEQQLDIRLFDRTTRQLHVSAQGRSLLPAAQRVLHELARLGEEAGRLKTGARGVVRLAVSQQLAASVMPVLMARFGRYEPDITVRLSDCSVEQVLRQVQSGEVDLGIGPERALPDDIQAERLFSLPFHVVLPERHPLARQAEIPWQALADERLIVLSGPFTAQLAAALPEPLAKRISAAEDRVNFLSTALGMVRCGLGLTLCLPYAADWVHRHRLPMRLLVQPVVERHFYAYSRKSRSLPPAAAKLAVYLQQHIESAWQDGEAV